MSFCEYSILENILFNANKILQVFESVKWGVLWTSIVYEKWVIRWLPWALSWGNLPLWHDLRKKKKKLPDGVSAVCLAVNFLWENATFADSNHKYNPIKSYYVNVNRKGDKTRQWNVSFRPKWVDFSGHKESPLGWLLHWHKKHANQATD